MSADNRNRHALADRTFSVSACQVLVIGTNPGEEVISRIWENGLKKKKDRLKSRRTEIEGGSNGN
jgi:hypothetical protein